MWKFLLTKLFKARDKFAVDLGGNNDVEKPFIEHLEDLRNMIVRMAITLILVTIATFVYYKESLALMRLPIGFAGLQEKIVLINMQPMGAFMTAMNISLVAGIVVAFPLLMYFLLQFILPGLKSTEKKVLWPALFIGAGLFAVGMSFGFRLVLPQALEFFYEFGTDYIGNDAETAKRFAMSIEAAVSGLKSNGDQAARTAELVIKALADNGLLVGSPQAQNSTGLMTSGGIYMWDLVAYVKFACQFVLLFGACFELPVVVMALVKLDVLNYRMMKGTRSYAAVIISIVAAIITPTPDAFTLSLLAVPMYVLYEICIWLAYFMEKKDREAYPEYYQQLEEDEKAMAADDKAAESDWDNEDYNPWSTAESDDDDDEAIRPKPVATTETEPKPAETESSTPEASDEKPKREKTLEEIAREDEERSGQNTD